MQSQRLTLAALAACIALVSAVSATRAAAQEGDSLGPLATGRAFTWGVAAMLPLLAGDVRESDGRLLRYLQPGGGVEGRLAYELSGGIALGVSGGVAAHASQNSRSLVFSRVLAEVRWTIDTGADLAPSLGIGAGLLLAQLDRGLAASACARVLGGIEWLLARWAALEITVAVELSLAGDAFADPIACVTPRFGLVFSE
jgi:hypothetical protein